MPITTNVSSNPAHDEMYSIQQYVIKFVSDLQQVGGFLWVLRFPPSIKFNSHDITEKWSSWSWSHGSWTYNYLLQSVPITTKVLGSNTTHGEMYSIQQYVIKFVSDLRQVGGFLRVLQFPLPIKLTTTI
jgi:hypothetical protein